MFALVAALATPLLASTSLAGASITVGRVAPGDPPVANCIQSPYDDVTVGGAYTMPANGTVTSWTHNAGSASGQQLTMKVFRRVSADTFMVVGHDGPRTMTPSGTAGN